MDLLRIAALVAAGPKTEKFVFRQKPGGPGDWTGDPVVSAEGSTEHRTVKSGDAVTWLGGVRTDVEREWTDDGPEDVELEFREVETADGFRGWVPWWSFDGDSGFEPT